MGTKRTPHKVKENAVDLSKPFNQFEVAKVEEGNCFGQMWDPSNEACQTCADIEVCGILFEKGVKKRAAVVEKDKGPFLDEARMHKISAGEISKWIQDTPVELTTEDLIEELLTRAKSKDRPSAIEWIKRFKTTGLITIKSGIIEWQGK